MKFIIIYLLIVNIILFTLMGIDKRKAKLNQWRISERTLFISAILGGSLGGILGIYTFRHKTKHFKFKLGFPLIFILQLIIIYIYYNYNPFI